MWLPHAGTRSLPAPEEYLHKSADSQASHCAHAAEQPSDQVSICSALGDPGPCQGTGFLTPVLWSQQASAQQVSGGAERRTGRARGQERVAVQAGEPEVCPCSSTGILCRAGKPLTWAPAACTAGTQFSSILPTLRRHITHLLPVVYEAADRSEAAMPELTEISFATGNANKLREVVAILEAGHPLPFRVKAANLDLPELQGDPEAIAMEKCRMAAQQVRAVWRRPAAGL